MTNECKGDEESTEKTVLTPLEVTPLGVTLFWCGMFGMITFTSVFTIMGYSNIDLKECRSTGIYLGTIGTFYLFIILVVSGCEILFFSGCIEGWAWVWRDKLSLVKSGFGWIMFAGGSWGYVMEAIGSECKREYPFLFVMHRIWIFAQITFGSLGLGMVMQRFMDFTKENRGV